MPSPGSNPSVVDPRYGPGGPGHQGRTWPPDRRPQRPGAVPPESPGCWAAQHRTGGPAPVRRHRREGAASGVGWWWASLSSGLRIWICGSTPVTQVGVSIRDIAGGAAARPSA